MHPTLFKIFSFPVPSYGTMLALSFLIGIFTAMHLAKKRGLNPDAISDLGLYVIISAIIGARLYYVMTHFHEFRGDLLSIVNPFQGGSVGISGLVMYGGFIAAIITATLFFKIKKLPPLAYLDVCSPSVGIGIALTRVGCFLNGCCYGAAAKIGSFLSIDYPHGSPAGSYQHHIGAPGLQPSQFYESAGGIAIFLILILAGRHKRAFAGLQFYLLIVLYAVLRFFVEMTRYIETQKIGPFSHNQVICIVLFTVFGWLILKNVIGGRTGTATPPVNKNG
ncbi:MAG: prolipoprotein diacylglyceryl transferase [Chitinispirillales bacterium]|jgi:phosphatidylglycerol:prolipoprotein diacylglycerol transferase|nr:prolipoprotein diacylglyceryl transferase [Chitinispirillales bacterium]